jgi:hypothetical protein
MRLLVVSSATTQLEEMRMKFLSDFYIDYGVYVNFIALVSFPVLFV